MLDDFCICTFLLFTLGLGAVMIAVVGCLVLAMLGFGLTYDSAMRECQRLRLIDKDCQCHIQKRWYGWVVIDKK